MDIQQQVMGEVAALAVALIPVVRAYIKTHWTPQRIAHVGDVARVAVSAAQQLGNDTGATGAAKLNFASELVVAGAKRFGVKLSDDEVVGFVHAALREMKMIQAGLAHV